MPVLEFPVSENYDVQTTRFQKWLSARKLFEVKHSGEHAMKEKLVLVPSQSDILFGRGKATRKHHGNLALGFLVESMLDQYQRASKLEKTELAQHVVTKLNTFLNSRFLKQGDDLIWTIVDSETAREKVSHTFWSQRSSMKEGKGKKRPRGSKEQSPSPLTCKCSKEQSR